MTVSLHTMLLIALLVSNAPRLFSFNGRIVRCLSGRELEQNTAYRSSFGFLKTSIARSTTPIHCDAMLVLMSFLQTFS